MIGTTKIAMSFGKCYAQFMLKYVHMMMMRVATEREQVRYVR